jgi:protein SCO1/2
MTRLRIALPLVVLLTVSCAERHDARGLVLKVDRPSSTVTVSHDQVPGFMDAMVMPFTVDNPQDLASIGPGDRISFRINVRGDRTAIDRVQILSAARTDSGLILSPARPVLVAIGEPLPDFTLIDQHGRPVSLHALRGKVVAVAFIYTRCPLPDYCPRVISNLSALRDRFGDQLGRDLVLLTVTFDPKYDTPGQLKAYAERYDADVPGWHFLTGSVEEIARVCAMFGVEFWPEEGLITHTLQTAVIDREGRLAAAAEGKDFTPRQLGDLVELSLDAGAGR